MSIIIHGIDMPVNCFECPVFKVKPGGVFCKGKRTALSKEEIGELPQIPKWCPLSEVPRHGRLVDAETLLDSLMQEMRRKNYDEKQILLLAGVMNIINAAPTIIEAEVKE